MHCKRKFAGYKALTAHLAGCPERNLKRIFDVGGYRFVLHMNPLHRVMRGLRDLQKKIRGQYTDSERIFMGAVICLSSMGYIKDYQIAKIDVAAEDEEAAKK